MSGVGEEGRLKCPCRIYLGIEPIKWPELLVFVSGQISSMNVVMNIIQALSSTFINDKVGIHQ